MEILLVEDDELLGDGIVEGLKRYGYIVNWIKDGLDAYNLILTEQFALIILDIGLPRMSGFEILEKIKEKKIIANVLILTALDEKKNIIEGLDNGANDYMVKPFDLDVLCARVRLLLRRETNSEVKDSIITVGNVHLDPAKMTVYNGDEQVFLSRREFILMQLLMRNAGRVLTRHNIVKNLYSWNDEIDSNALEVHVHNLRKKFGNNFIKTVHGVGYMVDNGK